LWIKSNTGLILLIVFLFCWVIFQLITFFTKINILKVIVLTGTFALAMAFAANDLVNFIGVPLAGLSSYNVAVSGSGAISQTMEALKDPVRSNTLFLLIAGIVMVITLWFSKKSRTVTKTELSLGRQDEGVERFGSSHISRTIVRMITSFSEVFQKVIPTSWLEKTSKRIDQKYYKPVASKDGELTSFDLLRASVNLMVASTLIALGTSMKLPLSTTYVTFMVSMGTSFSDRAWGRESAVYRVNGVLTVIGGWFFTALIAFTVSCIFATAIFYWRVPAVLAILGFAIFLLLRSSRVHKNRMIEEQSMEIFNLKKITDVRSSIDISFEHTGIFIQEVKKYLEAGFDGLFKQNRLKLKAVRKDTKKIQRWANIIIANIFKILRLLQKEDIEDSQGYSYTVGSLQEIAESLRDITLRAYTHIDNNHKGLLKVQIEELEQIKECISNLLGKTSETLMKKEEIDCEFIEKKRKKLNGLVSKFNENQIERIQDDSSKTRLSILFYGLLWDSQLIVGFSTYCRAYSDAA
jgi:MFS family permease